MTKKRKVPVETSAKSDASAESATHGSETKSDSPNDERTILAVLITN